MTPRRSNITPEGKALRKKQTEGRALRKLQERITGTLEGESATEKLRRKKLLAWLVQQSTTDLTFIVKTGKALMRGSKKLPKRREDLRTARKKAKHIVVAADEFDGV